MKLVSNYMDINPSNENVFGVYDINVANNNKAIDNQTNFNDFQLLDWFPNVKKRKETERQISEQVTTQQEQTQLYIQSQLNSTKIGTGRIIMYSIIGIGILTLGYFAIIKK